MSIGYYQLETGQVAAIENDCPFPPLDQALAEPNGLIAIGGDLTAERLLSAYRQGIFPWFNADEPVMWWSPNPRMVLFPDELRISNSLKKTLKKNLFEIRFNSAFRQVITACSESERLGQPGTWISPQMIAAYCDLHQKGHAICMESWMNNALVGGCYGVIINKMFYGESMFHTQTDASKVAFVHLLNHLKTLKIGMVDCQMKTRLLTSFGGREIDRQQFMHNLNKLVNF